MLLYSNVNVLYSGVHLFYYTVRVEMYREEVECTVLTITVLYCVRYYKVMFDLSTVQYCIRSLQYSTVQYTAVSEYSTLQ
jgi:hypothetical protein